MSFTTERRRRSPRTATAPTPISSTSTNPTPVSMAAISSATRNKVDTTANATTKARRKTVGVNRRKSAGDSTTLNKPASTTANANRRKSSARAEEAPKTTNTTNSRKSTTKGVPSTTNPKPNRTTARNTRVRDRLAPACVTMPPPPPSRETSTSTSTSTTSRDNTVSPLISPVWSTKHVGGTQAMTLSEIYTSIVVDVPGDEDPHILETNGSLMQSHGVSYRINPPREEIVGVLRVALPNDADEELYKDLMEAFLRAKLRGRETGVQEKDGDVDYHAEAYREGLGDSEGEMEEEKKEEKKAEKVRTESVRVQLEMMDTNDHPAVNTDIHLDVNINDIHLDVDVDAATESTVHDALHSNISLTPTSAYTLQTDTTDSTATTTTMDVNMDLTDKLVNLSSRTHNHTTKTTTSGRESLANLQEELKKLSAKLETVEVDTSSAKKRRAQEKASLSPTRPASSDEVVLGISDIHIGSSVPVVDVTSAPKTDPSSPPSIPVTHTNSGSTAGHSLHFCPTDERTLHNTTSTELMEEHASPSRTGRESPMEHFESSPSFRDANASFDASKRVDDKKHDSPQAYDPFSFDPDEIAATHNPSSDFESPKKPTKPLYHNSPGANQAPINSSSIFMDTHSDLNVHTATANTANTALDPEDVFFTPPSEHKPVQPVPTTTSTAATAAQNARNHPAQPFQIPERFVISPRNQDVCIPGCGISMDMGIGDDTQTMVHAFSTLGQTAMHNLKNDAWAATNTTNNTTPAPDASLSDRLKNFMSLSPTKKSNPPPLDTAFDLPVPPLNVTPAPTMSASPMNEGVEVDDDLYFPPVDFNSPSHSLDLDDIEELDEPPNPAPTKLEAHLDGPKAAFWKENVTHPLLEEDAESIEDVTPFSFTQPTMDSQIPSVADNSAASTPSIQFHMGTKMTNDSKISTPSSHPKTTTKRGKLRRKAGLSKTPSFTAPAPAPPTITESGFVFGNTQTAVPTQTQNANPKPSNPFPTFRSAVTAAQTANVFQSLGRDTNPTEPLSTTAPVVVATQPSLFNVNLTTGPATRRTVAASSRYRKGTTGSPLSTATTSSLAAAAAKFASIAQNTTSETIKHTDSIPFDEKFGSFGRPANTSVTPGGASSDDMMSPMHVDTPSPSSAYTANTTKECAPTTTFAPLSTEDYGCDENKNNIDPAAVDNNFSTSLPAGHTASNHTTESLLNGFTFNCNLTSKISSSPKISPNSSKMKRVSSFSQNSKRQNAAQILRSRQNQNQTANNATIHPTTGFATQLGGATNTLNDNDIPPCSSDNNAHYPTSGYISGRSSTTDTSKDVDYTGRLARLVSLKEEGKNHYLRSDYRASILSYTTAITTYTHHYGFDSNKITTGDEELAILHGNRSAASMMLGAYKAAAHDSQLALTYLESSSGSHTAWLLKERKDTPLVADKGIILCTKLTCRTGKALLKSGKTVEAHRAFAKAIKQAEDIQKSLLLGELKADGMGQAERVLNQTTTDATLGMSDIKRYNDVVREITPGSVHLSTARRGQALLSLDCAITICPGFDSLYEQKAELLASLKLWTSLASLCERLACDKSNCDGIYSGDLSSLDPRPGILPLRHLKSDFFSRGKNDDSVKVLGAKAVAEAVLRLPLPLLPHYLRALRLEERYSEAGRACAVLENYVTASYTGSSSNFGTKRFADKMKYAWVSPEKQKITKTKSQKEKGDLNFRNGNYDKAATEYSACLLIDSHETASPHLHKNQVESNAGGRLHAVLHCNRAACLMALKKYRDALKDCTAALRIHPHYMKAILRRGRCQARLERFEESLADFMKWINLVNSAKKNKAPSTTCTFDNAADVPPEEVEKVTEEMANVKRAMRDTAARKARMEQEAQQQRQRGSSSFPNFAHEHNKGGNNWDTFDGSGAGPRRSSRRSSAGNKDSDMPHYGRKHNSDHAAGSKYGAGKRGTGSNSNHNSNNNHNTHRNKSSSRQHASVHPTGNSAPANTHYTVLEITNSSSDAEIKKAYRKGVLKYHPDKNNDPGAIDTFRRVQVAYEILIDKEARRKYDAETRYKRSYTS